MRAFLLQNFVPPDFICFGLLWTICQPDSRDFMIKLYNRRRFVKMCIATFCQNFLLKINDFSKVKDSPLSLPCPSLDKIGVKGGNRKKIILLHDSQNFPAAKSESSWFISIFQAGHFRYTTKFSLLGPHDQDSRQTHLEHPKTRVYAGFG